MSTRVDRDVPLARYTTLGTGGPAALFARPESVDQLQELLEMAHAQPIAVETVGLGSNLLVADAGVEALVLRLGGALAAVELDGDLLVAGGGATNATCLHAVRAAGLAGFEFASAIPGTVGGGVCMNAGAYGSDFAAVLVDATVVSHSGARTLTARELGLGYRRSSFSSGEVVASARIRLTPADPAAIKRQVAALHAQRKASQPTTKRTFGSVFKNPSSGPGAGQLIEQSGLKGLRIGGAVISERHANFIENAGGATSADALALMEQARRAVAQRTGVMLEREVRFLGPIELAAM